MADNSKKPTPVLTKKHLDRMHREKRQQNMIIIGTVIVMALVVILVAYGFLDQQVLQYRRPVAVVNGEKISAEDFRYYTKYYRSYMIRNVEQTYQFAQMFGSDPTMIQQFAGQLVSAKQSLDPQAAGEKSVNDMVDNTVILQEAKKRGITVTNDEIEAKLHDMLGYFPSGTPTPSNTPPPLMTSTLSPLQLSMLQPTATQTPTGTLTLTPAPTISGTVTLTGTPGTPAPTFTATLAATETPTLTPTPTGPTPTPETPTPTLSPTPYTLEGYQSLYATVVADYNKNDGIPEATLRYVVMVQLYRDKLQKQVIGDIPCSEEQVWAQHILVPDKQTADDVWQKLQQGGDWFALASEYSTDTSNKDKGGDLGWFKKGSMVPEFENVAFSLQVGQISEPIQTQYGYHIIRLLGHEDRPLTKTECDTLKNTKFDDWVKSARDSSQVQVLDYWKLMYPLTPSLPQDISDAIDQLSGQQAPQTNPLEILTPNP